MSRDPASARHVAINIDSTGTPEEEPPSASGSGTRPGGTPTRARLREPFRALGGFPTNRPNLTQL